MGCGIDGYLFLLVLVVEVAFFGNACGKACLGSFVF